MRPCVECGQLTEHRHGRNVLVAVCMEHCDLYDVRTGRRHEPLSPPPPTVSLAIGTHEHERMCSCCDEAIGHDDASHTIADGSLVCDQCRSDAHTECAGCAKVFNNYGIVLVDEGYGNPYCERCLEDHAWLCEGCEEWFSSMSGHNHLLRCDDCGEEYDEDEGHECSHCGCEAPRMQFLFPANGDGTIGNDERLSVELPAGVISEAGLAAIGRVVLQATDYNYDASYVVESLEPVWQTRRGNFTKRLSSALWKKCSLKLRPIAITEVGNLARQHTSEQATYAVEFTRDLNLDASDFYNAGSCWWGGDGYGRSRCCLKSWGGMGLRSFNARGDVTGRAWVQPLDDSLQPTHDALGAHAYVVYNRYGELDGYRACRIVAHLTGKTYRRVGLDAGHQYVNDSAAHLVADEATCVATELVSYAAGDHDHLDADTYDREEAA